MGSMQLSAQEGEFLRILGGVLRMVADGAGKFTEIGPGSVLQGLVRRITGGGEILIEGIES